MHLAVNFLPTFGKVNPCVVKKLRVRRIKTESPEIKRAETTEEYLTRITGNPNWKKALGDTKWPLDRKEVHQVSKTAVELYRQTNGAVYFPGLIKPNKTNQPNAKAKHKMNITHAINILGIPWQQIALRASNLKDLFGETPHWDHLVLHFSHKPTVLTKHAKLLKRKLGGKTPWINNYRLLCNSTLSLSERLKCLKNIFTNSPLNQVKAIDRVISCSAETLRTNHQLLTSIGITPEVFGTNYGAFLTNSTKQLAAKLQLACEQMGLTNLAERVQLFSAEGNVIGQAPTDELTKLLAFFKAKPAISASSMKEFSRAVMHYQTT